MKLSIISPSITSPSNLEDFLNSLKEQDNQDFEIILALSSSNKKLFTIIEKYLEFFGTRLKFILNNKRRSIQSDIVCAFHLVSGQYVHILFSDNPLRSYFVRELINNASKYSADVFEFKPRLIGTLRWKPKARIEEDKVYKIAQNPEVIAYSFPFIFNKVFKKSLVQKFIKYRPKEMTDTKFSIELVYFLLINAKTYAYKDQRIVREFISSDLWLNPVNFVSQFKIVKNYINTNDIKLMQEIEYAEMYFMQIFLVSLLSSWKIRISLDVFKDRLNYAEKRTEKFLVDLYEYLTKKHANDQITLSSNMYMIKENIEANLLKILPAFNKLSDNLNDL